MKSDAQAYLRSLLEPVMEFPQALRISRVAGRQTEVLEIRCDARDLGRLIGRNGRTIGAIQILMGAWAQRMKLRVVVEMVQ